jgi:hypothetical protein
VTQTFIDGHMGGRVERKTDAAAMQASFVVIETNGIHRVLFCMQNRMFGPYLAAMHRILISAMQHRVSTK